jgi:signal transduction histidine kinase
MLHAIGKVYSSFKFFFRSLLVPKSKDTDASRREFILYILLVGSLILSLIATVSAFIGELNGASPSGSTVKVLTFFILFLLGYFAARKGQSRLVSYILILFYLLVTTYSSYLFGADVPQDLLTYALIVVMSGILLGSLSAFIVTLVIAIILLILTYLQVHHLLIISSAWKSYPTTVRDSIVYDITLCIIALVSWLFNREIEKALQRAKASEAELQKQKEQLEILVEERTQELRQAQTEKLIQLYRFVEFGRGASGLFHDLVNPLNILSLNLDQLSEESKKVKQKEMKSLINTALNNTKRLENFITAARKQLQNQDELRLFSIKEEITQVIQVLNYKMKKEHLQIAISGEKNIKTFNNPIKFSQLIMNLLANAIDSYEDCNNDKKRIEIILKKVKNEVKITVQDWGNGIKAEHVTRIFDPLFTTKKFEKGTGIGLVICRDIIEKSFNGKISVKSVYHKGTLFTIRFPLQQPPSGTIKDEL